VLTIGQGLMNPGAEFTTRTDSLVGRALVMIADDAGLIPAQSTISMTFLQAYIVEQLGLQIHTLKEPEIIDIALKDLEGKRKMELKNFVILDATSIDQQWHSKHIHTPNLCMPIIFGLPFLSHNNIVSDHALCSCIDKKTGYNLIKPEML
jgi:hypothetical protein